MPRTKWPIVIAGIACFCVCLLIAVLFTVRVSRWFKPYHDQQLFGVTTVGTQWLEITPKTPLVGKRQRQMIAFDLPPTIQRESDNRGLLLSDGSIVKVEVELMSTDGRIYVLSGLSYFWGFDGTLLAYYSLFDLPKNIPFTKVRIRSSQELPCNRIFWRDYNSWEAESPI